MHRLIRSIFILVRRIIALFEVESLQWGWPQSMRWSCSSLHTTKLYRRARCRIWNHQDPTLLRLYTHSISRQHYISWVILGMSLSFNLLCLNNDFFCVLNIGAGTGAAGGSSPNEIIGEATSTSCSPNFFCNLHCKVTSNTKILENSPASAALPQTPLYTAYTFFKKNILHKVVVWIWLSCLFFTNFCFLNGKVVQFLLPPTEISFPRLWFWTIFHSLLWSAVTEQRWLWGKLYL